MDELREAALTADGGDGLPEALVHPDPVPKNAMLTAEGPVLVDWTGAGRGPRLASMMLVLRSGWAARPFLRGYSRHITLTDDERDRFASLLVSRRLIDQVFKVCQDPATAAATATTCTRCGATVRTRQQGCSATQKDSRDPRLPNDPQPRLMRRN